MQVARREQHRALDQSNAANPAAVPLPAKRPPPPPPAAPVRVPLKEPDKWFELTIDEFPNLQEASKSLSTKGKGRHAPGKTYSGTGEKDCEFVRKHRQIRKLGKIDEYASGSHGSGEDSGCAAVSSAEGSGNAAGCGSTEFEVNFEKVESDGSIDGEDGSIDGEERTIIEDMAASSSDFYREAGVKYTEKGDANNDGEVCKPFGRVKLSTVIDDILWRIQEDEAFVVWLKSLPADESKLVGSLEKCDEPERCAREMVAIIEALQSVPVQKKAVYTKRSKAKHGSRRRRR